MVDEIVHSVDPEGDVLLVLRNPKAPFAIWDDSDWASQTENAKKSKKPRKREMVMRMKEMHPEGPSEAELAPSFQNTNIEQEPEVKFILSSRHLILASRYFNAKLNGTWKEATPHAFDNRHHMEASDWDPDALLILMHAIHGRTRSVPRRIDCEMLAKIAVLVDYYDCHEVVEVFSSMWIDALKDQIPSECNRDLLLWLCIAHVFKQDDAFAKITKTAILEGKGPMPTVDLPIPPIVIDSINWRRQDTIRFILDALNDVRASLLKSPQGSDHASSCMNLGALDRAMYKEELPELSEPYLGRGVTHLEAIVRGFESPAWNSYDHYNSDGRSYRSASYRLSSIIVQRLGSKSDKNKEGFTLAEVAGSDVSRREGKGKDSEDAPELSGGTELSVPET
ncbi:hypothetical protein LZ30DRAFT_581472 [Colletotrichum cereale]|nr:hypothetical protein LZ30DRAFT_581472 [Colletotrichum cereale]